MLEPLLNNLKSFEEDGLLVPCLGKIIKGTVFYVIADNFGAHSVQGFIESFSGSYICRYHVGQRPQLQKLEVGTGAFLGRAEQQHQLDIEAALASNIHSHGVKRLCAIMQRLNNFHVTAGFPPDVLHDLFEGIVPVELALCLDILKKKNISLLKSSKESLNSSHISGKTINCPQSRPSTIASHKTIGFNRNENWCLLRLHPLMVCPKVPEEEQTWQLLMKHKDVVKLVMSPIHTDESLGHTDSLIVSIDIHFSVFFHKRN